MGTLLRASMTMAALLVAAGNMPVAVAVGPTSSGFKQNWDNFTRFFKPPNSTEPANDATSLASQAKPGPELYLATARVYERSGRLDLAEKQYQFGLQLAPKHPGLLLGYARLRDRQGRLDEAIKIYQETARMYPEDAAVLNDMGLCFARHGKLAEGAASLEKAIRLQPQRKLYRNNIATMLVDMGRLDLAMTHLKAVYGEAVACYNLGYLVHKSGQSRLAAAYFARALEFDPGLADARIWLDRLASDANPGMQAAAPDRGPSLRIAMPPDRPPTSLSAGPDPSASRDATGRDVSRVPQTVARGRPAGPPRPLPPVEEQIQAERPDAAIGAGQRPALGRPTGRRPIALPPVDDVPPSSRGQTPADRSVPVPDHSALAPSSSGGFGSASNGLSRRRFEPPPTLVKPLPPVDDAPLPPGEQQPVPSYGR